MKMATLIHRKINAIWKLMEELKVAYFSWGNEQALSLRDLVASGSIEEGRNM